jgi:hypothetical protein
VHRFGDFVWFGCRSYLKRERGFPDVACEPISQGCGCLGIWCQRLSPASAVLPSRSFIGYLLDKGQGFVQARFDFGGRPARA